MSDSESTAGALQRVLETSKFLAISQCTQKFLTMSHKTDHVSSECGSQCLVSDNGQQ